MVEISPALLRQNEENSVWSVSHRLGSFRRISQFAMYFFRKSTKNGMGPEFPFGPFIKRTTATCPTTGADPDSSRFGPFAKRASAEPLFPFLPKGHRKPSLL